MAVATEISNIILAKTTILGIFLISRKMYSSVHLPIIFLESLCFTFPLFPKSEILLNKKLSELILHLSFLLLKKNSFI